jgi:hypothetical protein
MPLMMNLMRSFSESNETSASKLSASDIENKKRLDPSE